MLNDEEAQIICKRSTKMYYKLQTGVSDALVDRALKKKVVHVHVKG